MKKVSSVGIVLLMLMVVCVFSDKYYPSNGSGLATGERQNSGGDGYSCTASVSTLTDSSIYSFRFAKFTFQARVPAASGGYHNWSAGSEDWVEFIPSN